MDRLVAHGAKHTPPGRLRPSETHHPDRDDQRFAVAGWVPPVIALSLDEARNIALVAATAFAIAAIVAIWVMKTIVQKVLVAVLLVMLAFAAWSQRESLQECAEQVQANVTTDIANATASPTTTLGTTTDGSTPPASDGTTSSETTCTFFGIDVTIP